jgi:hypothetical protein
MHTLTVAHCLSIAKRKGLVIRKNTLLKGWCVTLPDGTSIDFTDDKDMCDYVSEY